MSIDSKSEYQLRFNVRCPQCGERYRSAFNVDNLCLICEFAEHDDGDYIDKADEAF